jgi:predicted ATP-grasp superfamily ATP-dependent carboligase
MRVLIATASTADDRKTLAAVRALGRNGCRVTVGGDRFLSAPFHSRYCRGRVRYPNPADGVERFLQALLARVRQRDYDVLLPLCDYTTVPLAWARDELERHVRTALPDYDTLLRAHDKRRLLELARDLGLDVPETHAPSDVQEARRTAEGLGYPCVRKPRRGAGGEGVRFLSSADEIVDTPPNRSDLVFDDRPLLQEYVPGETHDVCALFSAGEPRALLSQRRLRMYPSRGGVGILNETTDDAGLKARAETLLRALRWHGPAQVEFRVDGRRTVLMEVNARFWGTLGLAIRAGINFPLMACRVAVDGDVEPVRTYRVGLRYRWAFPYGLRYALETRRWRQAARDFLGRGACSDLSLSDPAPHVVSALRGVLS